MERRGRSAVAASGGGLRCAHPEFRTRNAAARSNPALFDGLSVITTGSLHLLSSGTRRGILATDETRITGGRASPRDPNFAWVAADAERWGLAGTLALPLERNPCLIRVPSVAKASRGFISRRLWRRRDRFSSGAK